MLPLIEQIGDATLYLGDCLEILPTLGPVDAVISDPPYERHMHDAKAKRRTIRTDGQKDQDPIDFASIEDIRQQFCHLAKDICGGWFLAFCTPEGVAPWRDAIAAAGMRYKRACVWVKPDSAPQFNGQGPAMGAENFVAAWAGKGHSRWNGGGRRGVFTHNSKQPTRTGLHPTEKPVPLMSELVSLFTDPLDVVIDPFMGVGTTGIACAQTVRKFIGIEISEKYFDIACRRLEQEYSQTKMDLAPATEQGKQTTMGLENATS
jgi:DNA modification methylase